MTEKVRIDKWLWAVRLFKTRSLSAEACEKGKVKIAEQTVKASRTVKIGDIIVLHRGPWQQTVKVVNVIERRIGAALVKEYMEDITTEGELEKFRLYQLAQSSFHFKGGEGRPTKKERRDLDDYTMDW
ncbi:MAG: hypothetical protein RLZZ94_1207 [Bacteroidota bacterium]|jgi:ribosome-associated heat shock protein Hsp15